MADTRAGAEAELEQLKEDYKTRRLGLVDLWVEKDNTSRLLAC